MKLLNKGAIITGASQGLGKEIASHFVKEGASVSICARTENDLNKTLECLMSIEVSDSQKIFGTKADVSCQEDVQNFIDQSIKELGKIDCVVNNAGVFGPKGNIDVVDLDKWVKTFNINIMGIVYVCREIIPHFKNNKGGRIINLSGGGATSPMPGASAYAATKAGVVRLTETLALEFKDDNIFINAIAPGALNTRLLDEMLEENDGEGKLSEDVYEKTLKHKQSGGTPLNIPASLCVYLASDESAGITGKLISAVWDDWKNFHNNLDELSSDIYTLRRIVPKDEK